MKNCVVLVFLYFCCDLMKADMVQDEWINYYYSHSDYNEGPLVPIPQECRSIANEFADYASDFTRCSITNARPITLCAQCINQFVNFHCKFEELLSTTVNGTSCKALFISRDRLDVLIEYYYSLLAIWDKGHCYECFDWNHGEPELSNNTKTFHIMFEQTRQCIKDNFDPSTNNTKEVCEMCMDNYVQLDKFYKSLSTDAIGVDSVCMDIVDLMNTTRSIWSKNLNCCNLRRSPEIIFLCCTAIIAMLPILFYLIIAYCGPIRDLPNVLKQSRFKQIILRSQDESVN